MARAKRLATIKAIIFHCPVLGRDVRVTVKVITFYSSKDECGFCGSHGSMTLDFKCKCGELHEVELSSW